MNIIRNLPTPIAGLALGSVALGNLLQPYSPTLQLLFSLLSLIIIVLLTIKFVLGFDKLKKEMENPVVATVLATYPMSIFKKIYRCLQCSLLDYWNSSRFICCLLCNL